MIRRTTEGKGEPRTLLQHLTARPGKEAVTITPLTVAALEPWLAAQPAATRRWVERIGFTARPGTTALLPDAEGALARVLLGVEAGEDIWSYGGLPGALPPGRYRLDDAVDAAAAGRAALGWALGGYAFTRYKAPERDFAVLVWPKGVDKAAVTRAAEATFLVRDLINTPAEDMGPPQLAAAAKAVARRHGAKVAVTTGDALLKKNYPMIHAVGRAADRAPRLIDLRWGTKGPRVTLVGKGVCFDSGGLDLKSAAGMKLMKKDMGGAAHVLGLAQMIMAAELPLRLRMLIPAVENSVSGNAFRPLDVIRTRQGLTVEIGHTDAEGRLILCDAMTEADREEPDLLVDFATLTGAARVALGTELPALFCNDDATAAAALEHGLAAQDPLWRLPLHAPYKRLLDSKVADLNNVSEGGYGGAITAALFLESFVAKAKAWIHIDVMAWNLAAKPGRPAGGEAMGLRAIYGLIEALARAG